MEDELLVIKKQNEKLKFKLVKKQTKGWSPSRYERIIAGKDYNLLALLFYDLSSMGFDVEKAYNKYKSLKVEPDLFFLK